MRILAIALTAAIVVACAEPAARGSAPGGIEFRVVSFVPEAQGTVFYGYTPFDRLPARYQASAISLGYKAGDQIPTKRLDGGIMYFLKPPARELRTKDPNAWVRQ